MIYAFYLEKKIRNVRNVSKKFVNFGYFLLFKNNVYKKHIPTNLLKLYITCLYRQRYAYVFRQARKFSVLVLGIIIT